jgi:hypothetical protein
MALRFLLVGLVMGLGVDLPSGQEIASWARAGGEWLQARIDGAFGPEAVAEAEAAPDAEFAAIVDQMAREFGAEAVAESKANPDTEFAAIVDQMAGSFTADLAMAEGPATPQWPAFEPIEVPDDPTPGLAFALNRASQAEERIPGPPAPEVATAPITAQDPAASDRLASAVRLTREAASAWMSLIRGAEATVRVR